MILTPTTLSTTGLCYHGRRRYSGVALFTAEASSLPKPGRVYDDACDEGYTIYNPATGRAVVLVLDKVERDPREREIQAWVYVSARRSDPAVALRVFND